MESSVVARKPLETAGAPGSAGHVDIALFFVVRADSTTPERRSDASRPVRLPPTRTPPRATSHEPRRASRDAPPAVAREPLDVADPALPAAQSVERVLERKCKPRPLQTLFRPRPCATGPRRRAPAAAQPSRRAPRTTLSTPPRPLGEGKRRRPGVTDSTDGEHDALEPRRGPQTHSRGVASEDAAEVSRAYEDAEAPFSAWPKASDAPGEGKKKAPGVAEHADRGGKPMLEPPPWRRREAGE